MRMTPLLQRAKPAAFVLLPLIGTFGAAITVAADGDVAAATGTDAADYFVREALVSEHPFHAAADRAKHGAKSPLGIWEGARDSYLRGTLKAEGGYFDQGNAWFGNAKANIGASTGSWYEWVVHPGVEGSYFFEQNGEVYGRFSVVNGNTEDIDAAGSNVGQGNNGDASHTAVENAYLGWRSGDLFGSLGKDFLDVSFGMQQYVAGNGFLLYSQSSNGGSRGAYWSGERKAAEYAGIAKVNYGNFKGDLVYFKANDNPDSDTKVGGVTLDYALGDFGSVGGGYYSVDSDIQTRDGMDVYDVRFQTTPFKAFDTPDVLKPVRFDGEYVYEDNGNELEADGWYLAVGYDWSDVTWKPGLTYRYAAFQGDSPDSSKSQNFDPLFYGFYDWGYWFQGEILGEYVLTNSNLNSHMVRLSVDPLNSIHVNLFFYRFKLDNASGFGVQSDDFADEWNLTIDWTANDSFAMSLVGAYAKPDDGAKEFSGGDDDWSYGMLYATYSFK
jgi:hypothetical protein